MVNNSYKYLVASDMDYTLLMPGQDVSSKNREAIKALQDMGVAFTIATGRTSFLVGKYADDLKITIPCITSNGGALFDPIELKEVYTADMDDAAVEDLIRIGIERGIDYVGYASDVVYFRPDSKRKQFFYDYNKGTPERLQAKMADLTLDMAQSRSLSKLSKILFVGADEATVSEVMARKDVEACFSAADFLDIMAPGSSKGSGLLELAKFMNISIENTFAVGDNDNDLSMLLASGHGIAMGNSSDYVKSKAEYVTTSCEEDGFAAAVFDYIIPAIKKAELQ